MRPKFDPRAAVRLIGFVTVCLPLAACGSTTWIRAGYVAQFRRADAALAPDHPDFKRTVQIQWLGVAGYLISLDGNAVLLAPFYSKQSLLKVGLGSLDVRTDLIDRRLPPVGEVEAILVGHAHYDHLLDVPYIATKHATKATIYGSRTTVNILAGFGLPESRRVEAARNAWTYTSSRRIRFAAFPSEHAPHVGRILHFWSGEVKEPLTSPPRYAREFQEGLPLSYLIEFLDPDGNPTFTIFFQDSSSTGGVGAPSLSHRSPDVAILCVPSWRNVDDYPRRILSQLRPKHVLLGHFDDFFQDPEEEMEFLFHDETEAFVAEAQRVLDEFQIPAVLHVPSIDARMNFPVTAP